MDDEQLIALPLLVRSSASPCVLRLRESTVDGFRRVSRKDVKTQGFVWSVIHHSSFIIHHLPLCAPRLGPRTRAAEENAGRPAALHRRRTAGRRRHGQPTTRAASRARSSRAGPCSTSSAPWCEGTSDVSTRAGRRSTPPSASRPRRAISAATAARTAAPRPWPSGWPILARPCSSCERASWARSTRIASTN